MNVLAITFAFMAISLGLLLAMRDNLIFGRWWEYCPALIEKFVVLSSHYLGIHSMINSSRIVYGHRGMKPDQDDLSFVQTEDTYLGSVPTQVYRPVFLEKSKRALAVLYIPGGGFVYASRESHNGFCYRLARSAGVVVFLIQYRRAPEYIFPTPVNDCYEASTYLVNNADNFTVDKSKIVLMGDGSGGNFAAAVSLELATLRRKCVQFGFAAQVLIYPTLQFFDFTLPSFKKDATEVAVSTESIATAWSLYINGTTLLVDLFLSGNHSYHLRETHFQGYLQSVDSRINRGLVDPATVPEHVRKALTDPRACPLLADDLRQNPPTLIITADHDVLRDDAILYGVRLRKAGVKVTHNSYSGQHEFLFLDFNGYFAAVEARQAFNDIVSYLEEIFKNQSIN